jgi:hypothetical protein
MMGGAEVRRANGTMKIGHFATTSRVWIVNADAPHPGRLMVWVVVSYCLDNVKITSPKE